MPRTSRCPTCDTNVKVPDAAKRGSFVRCPSCEETFQPPFLKPVTVVDEEEEDYDPETAEAFGMRAHQNGEPPKTRADHAKEQVRRQVNRAHRTAAEQRAHKPHRGWFEGIEGFFLASAIALGIGVPAMYFGVKQTAQYSEKGAAVVLVVAFFAMVVFYFWLVRQLKTGRVGWLDYLFGVPRRD
ncbi:hypothetical protein [Limnoglobus roseus]|uniref:Uncharacterized protein n=1 Tax=Limnoglobus roseus TaxID=2598579 RepID=A0A5C1AHI7_9BACT|nr:hypothetical protein [Limnoglobus roseus]QEL16594.1 hypothetical protein PX52LOC_03554 [Limnoglobus roseus]